MCVKYRVYEETGFEFVEVNIGQIDAILCTLGASLRSLECFGHQFFLTPDDPGCFISSKGYYGKTLGPIAGRYDDNDYHGKGKKIVLHGGENGLSFKVFKCEVKERKGSLSVSFSICLNDDTDYVGNKAIYNVSYLFDKENKLTVMHKITALEDTYASMSEHFYFSLKETDIRNTYLKLESDEVSMVGDDYLINGFRHVPQGMIFDGSQKLKDKLIDSPLLKKGHHFKSIKYPIVINDEVYKVIIESSYPDVLLTVDQLPCGEVCQKEIETPFRAYVIEPEIAPSNKERLYIRKGDTRVQTITYKFEKL